MQESKYMTMYELDRHTILGKHILVLPEHDIDIALLHNTFRLEGRQVWYGEDTMVFPKVPVKLPKKASLIEVNTIKKRQK